MKIARILPIDQEAIEKTIALRQQKKMKLGDAIIAATALVNDLTLITRNMADFDAIPGLRLLDPWNI